MIHLGTLSNGTMRIAMAARKAIIENGQCDIFASCTTGECVAVPYTDIDYAWHQRRQAEHLVGTYTDEVCDDPAEDSLRRALLLRDINDALVEHVKQSRWWFAAKVSRRAA